MAGVKGRSGGARPNSGGARPGAGRKPKPKPVEAAIPAQSDQTPLEFLLSVQNNPLASPMLRVRAAIAAAQYVHVKRADGGKRDEQAHAATKASKGRFAAAAPPPKLVVSNK